MKLTGAELDHFLLEVGEPDFHKFNPRYWLPFGREWARWENTTAAYNPLASTDGSVNLAGTFNSHGVKDYASFGDGVLATIRTISPGSHYTQYVDYYKAVREAIQAESIDRVGRSLVASQMRKWGTVGFANQIEAGWNPTPVIVPEEPDVEDDDYVFVLNEAIQKRMAITRLANDPDLVKVTRGYELLKAAGLLGNG